MRRWIRTTQVCVLSLFAVSLVIGCGSKRSGEAMSPAEARATSYFGLNGSKMFHVPDQPEVYGPRIAWMNELGVGWDRADLWWHIVEPEPGRFDFSRPDRVFDELERHGIQWYPILCYGAAGWKDRNAPQTDAEIDAFANYAYRVVSRYKDRAKIWSLWNEPNILPFWSPQPDPARYAQMMKAVRAAVRRADPEAQICAPVIAPLGAWDRKFVERLYQLGIHKDFDIFDYHYYRNHPPETEVPKELAEIRAVMRRHGDDKPIWVSESGVNSPIGDKPESYDRQAAYVVRNQLLCLALGVKRFFYFDLQNWHDNPEGSWDASLGLVEAGGNKKPSFQAYKTLVAEVDHKEIVGRGNPFGDGGKDVECVLIHDPRTKEYTLAVWRTGSIPAPAEEMKHSVGVLCEKKDIRVVGPFGEETVYPLADDPNAAYDTRRTVVVPIDGHPRYIHGVAPEGCLAAAAIRLDPALTILAPGEETSVALHVHPLMKNADARISLTRTPAAFKWDAASGALVCKENLPSGRYEITALIEYQYETPAGMKPGRMYRSAEVEIVPTLSLSLRPSIENGMLSARATVANRSARTLDQPMRLVARTDGAEAILDEAAREPIEPNATRAVDFPMEDIRLSEYAGSVDWVLKYGSEEARPFRVGVARFGEAGPVVDGDFSEWEGIPEIALDRESQIARNSGVWTKEDASARVRAWFTGDTMSIAAEVADDGPLHNPNPPLRMYQGDALEVFVGFQGPSSRTVIDKAVEFQIGLAPTSDTGKPSAFWFHKDVPIDGATVVVLPTESGYRIEASIPLKELGVSGLPLKSGTALAFDVTLDDLDADDWAPAGNDPGRSLAWTGGAANWIDPSGWGMIVLKDR